MDAPAPTADADHRHFLRYTRTRSWPMLQRFPIGDDSHTDLLARMLGSTPDAIRTLHRSLDDEIGAAAGVLLADDAFRQSLAGLPFRPGERVVALGDSITADRLGWFDLLAAAVGRAGPPGATMINLGVSGNTTADVLERYDLIEAAAPTRVLLMLGTNDARRHGRRSRHRMVTSYETERNLRAITDLVTEDLGAPVTVITPPAVDQHRIDAFFRDAPVHWEADTVAEVAEVVRKTFPAALDLHVTGAGGELLEADGVHPSPAGQQAILRRIVEHLGAA